MTPRLRLPGAWGPVDRRGLGGVAAGLVLLAVVSLLAAHRTGLALEVVAVLIVLIGSILVYLVTPAAAVSATIVIFALLPAGKVFVSPSLGGVKDVICIGAFFAAAGHAVYGRRRVDGWVAALAGLFVLLYLADPEGDHGRNWFAETRLVAEPVLLMLTGWVLPNPRRTLRVALTTLTVMGLVIAVYGLLQQAIGGPGLVSLGYAYNDQVRYIGSDLRSFGTLDDPFSYSAMLYLAIAAAVFTVRRGWAMYVIELVLLLGLAVSFVRTAALVVLAYLGLLAIRRRFVFPAACVAIAVAAIAAVTLVKSNGTQTQSYTVFYANGGYQLISRPVSDPGGALLNGRVSAWKAAVGDRPLGWVFGRGVGEVGTGANRASVGAFAAGNATAATAANANSTAGSATASAFTVDNSYFATIADVGLVGLFVVLAMFGRMAFLGIRAIERGRDVGWIPVVLLTALLLDAVTRASFSGFPAMSLGMLVIGVALAVCVRPDEAPPGRGEPAGLGAQPAPSRNASMSPRTRPGVRSRRQASP